MKRASITTLLCVLAIVLFLVLLALLPGMLRQKKYAVPSDPEAEALLHAPRPLPLTHRFAVIRADSSISHEKTVALKALLPTPDSRLIINFWATWCPPCLEELPSLEYLNRQLQTEGNARATKLVTISVDDSENAVERLYQTLPYKLSFLVLWDPKGEFASSIGTDRFPETYLINQEGEVLYKWLGPQDWLSLDVIEKLK